MNHAQFEAYLRTQGVPNTEQAAYAKWLRYSLDFCPKYHFPEEHRESLVHSSSNSMNRSTGVSWREVYARLAQEIQVRHYSPKTLKNYTQWMQHFQTFTRSKDPNLLSSVDVKEFLTFLAVTKKVSASTQNQAFNALIFFYRHVLNKEFGKIEGVVRAKRKTYIPVVLSREEIDAILKHLFP